MDYSCIIFDTAPTGHTLRLLQFPSTLEKGLSKLANLKGAMGGMMTQVPLPPLPPAPYGWARRAGRQCHDGTHVLGRRP